MEKDRIGPQVQVLNQIRPNSGACRGQLGEVWFAGKGKWEAFKTAIVKVQAAKFREPWLTDIEVLIRKMEAYIIFRYQGSWQFCDECKKCKSDFRGISGEQKV